MAETLLNRVLNDEIDSEDFLEWLTLLDYQVPKFVELSTEYKCSRTDFVTFFLNFVHEEIGSVIGDNRKSEEEESKSSSETNRSHNVPLDLSLELSESITNSTPKITKVSSDTSMTYMSPISPIYKPYNSFSTPKKSSICLGDFIINKKVSSKKKQNSENKKRIKPTNLNQSRVGGFQKSENSFNFKSEVEDFPKERNLLTEERLKILSRSLAQNVTGSPKIITRCLSGEVRPDPKGVTHQSQIKQVVKIYSELLDNSFVLNLTSEIYFLISLLLKKQNYGIDWGIEILDDKSTSALFTTLHNVVFFASKSLETQVRVLKNYDNSTIRLLTENQRLKDFAPLLIEELLKVCKPDRILEVETCQNNICFNSDTDNRQNFPNDPSFHAFRKQRDLFYEILRIWELYHLSPGFNFVVSLSGKIKTLLSLGVEPTNFIHFARLFKAQLLNSCRNGDNNDFITSLDVDAQKLSKLRSRCITKGNSEGLNSLPNFNEGEEFYKDFIIVGANYSFNRHLADALIEEITELNESNFGSNEIEEERVDCVTKKSYYTCIKNLRILAKFLGFVESLPYKTDCHYSEHLLATHLKIRQQIRPNFDVKTLLENSIKRKSLILCIPWLIKYLSMFDHVTLKLPYYTQIHTNLFWIYRNFDWGPDNNIYLIRFCLGWLFELPNIPDNNYLHFCTEASNFNEGTTTKFCLDKLEIVDQDILYFCCPYLDEIKKLLSTTLISHSITIKHITPVTALQSPDELARKKLEQQLEEAFFNGQPLSLRKTIEFVSERVASTCVKYICNNLVPNHKKSALERFRSIEIDEDQDVDARKAALKTKSNELAAICLKELRGDCDREIELISKEKIEKAVDSLVSLDILQQTRHVCVGITKKSCLERVKQWIDSHVTLGLFTKDFGDGIQKITSPAGKKPKKPVFVLPSGGTNIKHNDRTMSAAHLLEKYRDLTIRAIEHNPISLSDLVAILDATSTSISQRGDFNQCILSTICTQLLDLMLLLLSRDWLLVVSPDILSKSCDIWRLYYNGCDDLFKSLLCHRNVMFFAKSNNVKATWDAFAKFCAYLIKNHLLSCEVFEAQCTGIFRTDWDQDTLKLITDFFKMFGGLYRDQGGSTSDFMFLLDFFSDYCEDLF